MSPGAEGQQYGGPWEGLPGSWEALGRPGRSPGRALACRRGREQRPARGRCSATLSCEWLEGHATAFGSS